MPTKPVTQRRFSLLAVGLGLLLGASSLGAAAPAGAATGDEIVFMRYFPQGLVIEDIYSTGFGTGATQLTNSPTVSDNQPVWSPDGTKILFRSSNSLAVMNADGTGYSPLPGTNASSPAWSPDGTRIAFSMGWGDQSEIFVYSLSGGGSLQLTTNAKGDRDPAWSPDGSRIVFSRNDPSAPGYEYDLWVMRADGSSQTQLTSAPGWEVDPDWSPDGTTIAYAHGNSGFTTQVWIVGATGSGPQQLTYGTYSDMPAWSPTGTHIAFSRGKDVEIAPAHIWVIRVRSGAERQVTFGQDVRDRDPDWR